MIRTLRRGLDALWGRGEASITIPSMDGALRPNDFLDRGSVIWRAAAPDNLVADGRTFFFSSERTIFAAGGCGAAPEPREVFNETVSCLAAHDCGALAVGVKGAIHLRGGSHDRHSFVAIEGRPLLCPTALAFDGPDTLILCLGSQINPPEQWKRDLLERNRTGSVWRLDLASGKGIRLADALGFPFGVLVLPSGEILISESWSHRVLRMGANAPIEPVLSDLPGYPARMASSTEGGSWLTVFAPRRQMVEFVLREKDYRERMMREVHPDCWMAPALCSGRSFLEPLQGGAVKHLGILKPWAPTRSYGLAIRLDAAGSPITSLHSRADGTRHGITSCLEVDGRLLLASKGGGVVVSVDLKQLDEE